VQFYVFVRVCVHVRCGAHSSLIRNSQKSAQYSICLCEMTIELSFENFLRMSPSSAACSVELSLFRSRIFTFPRALSLSFSLSLFSSLSPSLSLSPLPPLPPLSLSLKRSLSLPPSFSLFYALAHSQSLSLSPCLSVFRSLTVSHQRNGSDGNKVG